jgi:DNA-binding protein H-NS
MSEYGITVADLGSAKSKEGGRKRGRPVGSKNAASAAGRKAGKAVTSKGILPPKYMDPKTGATWSGHARPPAWIKDAKDRSVFLIDKAAVTAPSTQSEAAPKRRSAGTAAKKAKASTTSRKKGGERRARATGKATTATV